MQPLPQYPIYHYVPPANPKIIDRAFFIAIRLQAALKVAVIGVLYLGCVLAVGLLDIGKSVSVQLLGYREVTHLPWNPDNVLD